MSFTAFPIRLQWGFLERCDEARAVLALVEIMARTPHGSWAGCPHFGLRDYFEAARLRPGLPQSGIRDANRALEDLGLSQVRIVSVERDGSADLDTDSYIVAIALGSGREYRHAFTLR